MKHYILIILFSAFILDTSGQYKKANKEFEKGLTAFKANDFIAADSLFLLSLDISASTDICFKIADLYLQNNDTCKYCAYLFKSLEFSDNGASALYSKDCSKNDTTYYGNSKYAGYVTYLSVVTSHRCKDDIKQVFIKQKKYGDIIYMFSYVDTDKSNIRNLKYFPDFKSDIDNIVFDRVEMWPNFSGGENALYKFLASNIIYPNEAKANGISGRVFVTYIVNTNGSISNTEVIKSVNKELDQEAIRVINLMPNWMPGRVEGINVRTRINLPLSFSIQK